VEVEDFDFGQVLLNLTHCKASQTDIEPRHSGSDSTPEPFGFSSAACCTMLYLKTDRGTQLIHSSYVKTDRGTQLIHSSYAKSDRGTQLVNPAWDSLYLSYANSVKIQLQLRTCVLQLQLFRIHLQAERRQRIPFTKDKSCDPAGHVCVFTEFLRV
jgi:hypothetical protein